MFIRPCITTISFLHRAQHTHCTTITQICEVKELSMCTCRKLSLMLECNICVVTVVFDIKTVLCFLRKPIGATWDNNLMHKLYDRRHIILYGGRHLHWLYGDRMQYDKQKGSRLVFLLLQTPFTNIYHVYCLRERGLGGKVGYQGYSLADKWTYRFFVVMAKGRNYVNLGLFVLPLSTQNSNITKISPI